MENVFGRKKAWPPSSRLENPTGNSTPTRLSRRAVLRERETGKIIHR